MSEHPIDLASRIIDTGAFEPSNRVTNQLSELADGVALVESFSHSVAVDTGGEGLVVFDTSGVFTGRAVTEALRGWSTAPAHTVVYTHGHADHVGGSGALVADGRQRGHADPRVIGHEAVAERFRRYERTNGWNLAINARQFGGISPTAGLGVGGGGARFLPADVAWPTDTYDSAITVRVGQRTFELHHDRGETDDHTWAWFPEQRMLFPGDLFIWVFPNAGNPQKVQRYPDEWARALRRMAALQPELFVPAHGLPIAGAERIAMVLDDAATALEGLVAGVLERMNAGLELEQIVAEVTVPAETLEKPYLLPVYDEPEFVVRNIWRRFGGWWDGNAASLKPPRRAEVGEELVGLAGGLEPVLVRAESLGRDGQHALACELVELAARARPEDAGVHELRAALYQARRDHESSLMSKGIYAAAARSSQAAAGLEAERGATESAAGLNPKGRA
ncbi:MAG: alkyl sulfatase dimerization domain-containing protein [Microthrixaceae bacterium]